MSEEVNGIELHILAEQLSAQKRFVLKEKNYETHEHFSSLI